jgi:Domain of unknown function (DUF4340)
MSRQRLTALIVIALLAFGGASYLATRRNGTHDTQGTLLVPTLAAQVNGVTEVSVIKGSATPVLNVRKIGDTWTVAERADYPADVAKLRRLLLSLTDAKIIEEKTSNPASYPVIGVEDPSKTDASGAEISLTAADGKHAVIVGKSSPEGTFVRRAGEEKSYSVSPSVSVDAEPRFWIDTKLLDLSSADIVKVEVKLADGSSYMIHRPAPVAAATPPAPAASAASAPATPPPPPPPPAEFTLDGVPVGRKAADARSLAPSATTFSNLTIDDVAPADSVDFAKSSVVTVSMNSGNVVTLTGTVVGDKHWIKVADAQDAALTAKASGRVYEISNYRYDAIFRPVEKLLVPKPEPEAKKPSANAKK